MTWQTWSVLPVWVLSIVAAIAIVMLAPTGAQYTWLGLALAGAVILTFTIQLASQQPQGFVNRAMASIAGAVVVVAIAAGAIQLLG